MMQIFEVAETEDAKTIRLVLGMSIKNDSLRRLWLMVTVPFMLAFNILQVVVFAPPLFIATMLRVLALNNVGLWDMTITRWNTPRGVKERVHHGGGDDEAGC